MKDEFETGFVKSMRKDGKSVCISVDTQIGPQDAWMDLAEQVKPAYIHVGSKCQFQYLSQGEGNPVLTFIKCEGGARKPFVANSKPSFQSGDKVAVEDESMARMSALKAAGNVYQGSGKEADFKRLTEEIVEYIKGGNWSNEKKLVEKSKVSTSEGESYI